MRKATHRPSRFCAATPFVLPIRQHLQQIQHTSSVLLAVASSQAARCCVLHTPGSRSGSSSEEGQRAAQTALRCAVPDACYTTQGNEGKNKQFMCVGVCGEDKRRSSSHQAALRCRWSRARSGAATAARQHRLISQRQQRCCYFKNSSTTKAPLPSTGGATFVAHMAPQHQTRLPLLPQARQRSRTEQNCVMLCVRRDTKSALQTPCAAMQAPRVQCAPPADPTSRTKSTNQLL